MSRDFELVTLACESCGSPLAAEGEDVVYYCVSCYNGYRLAAAGETAAGGEGLLPVEVSFVAAPAVEVHFYRPFWLLPAQVTILRRQASGGTFAGIVSFFLGDDDDGGGTGEGTFAIPAYRAPLAQVVELALRYTRELPRLGQKLGERLTGGTVSVEDARKLAHYALIASEARKPDMLKELEYRLELGEPRLLGVPFLRTGGASSDALYGLPG